MFNTLFDKIKTNDKKTNDKKTNDKRTNLQL